MGKLKDGDLNLTAIDPQTVQAYKETDYRIDGPMPFVMRIGTECRPLRDLLEKSKADCACFITACNPFSEDVGDLANAERQEKLATALRLRSLAFREGVGRHPDGHCPAEPSFLVIGLSLEAAKTLGRECDQNAIVWSGADAVPQLILLR